MRTALGFLFLASAAVTGQQVIRVETKLVLVNVTVEDKDGKTVADLAREDFAVFDGKKQEQIRVFSRQSDELLRSEPAPLPPATYTNRIEARGAVPTAVTAIVIDQLNTPWRKQHYNRDLILKALQAIDPHHRVALYVLGTQLRVLHDFTSDTESLIAVLKRASGTPNTAGNRLERRAERGPEIPALDPVPPAAGPVGEGGHGSAGLTEQRWIEFDAMLRETEATNAIVDAERRTRMTLTAIEGIAARLSRIAGRKNLVWVSSGFATTFFEYLNSPQDRVRSIHLLREFERTSRALVNSGIAVYSVQGGDSGVVAVDVNQQAAISSAGARRWEMNAWNSMLEISSVSGGRAFGNIHQIGEAMSRAAADSRLSYTIGFYPSHDKWDGAFREIKVTVKRPGVRVRHRSGYVALAARAESPEERRQSLLDAAWSPLDATAIPIDIRITPAAKPNTSRFTVMIDPAAVTFTGSDRLHTCALDILYLQQRRDGSNLLAAVDSMSPKLNHEQYGQVMRQRIGMNKELEIAAGAERLRVVVRDAQSGAVGSITVPIARP